MGMKRGLGWQKDVDDPKDHDHALHLLGLSEEPAESLALLSHYEPVDQGATEACGGASTAQAIRCWCLANGYPETRASALSLYRNARALGGVLDSDVGCRLRDVFRGVTEYGIVLDSEWPLDPSKVLMRPPIPAVIHAYRNRTIRYRRIVSSGADDLLSQIRRSLASNRPVVMGIPVYESFTEERGPEVIEAPEPATDGALRGWHAVCLLGYRADGAIAIGNSWSRYWRTSGTAFLRPDYVARGQDPWAIEMVPREVA